MDWFTDTVLIIAFLNFISMLGNVIGNMYYTIKTKEAHANGELIKYWKGKYDQAQNTIETMHRKKKEYRLQYETALQEIHKLEGKVEALTKDS